MLKSNIPEWLKEMPDTKQELEPKERIIHLVSIISIQHKAIVGLLQQIKKLNKKIYL